MRKVLAFTILSIAAAVSAQAQCGDNGKFNGIGRAGDVLCTGKTGAAAYAGTFTAVTTVTITASTHGQGLTPVGFCYDNATPASPVALTAGYPQLAANGDITFAWTGSKTGKCLVSALGSVKGDVGVAGGVGASGESVAATNEAPGVNCANGGVKFTSISGINYACNGATSPPAGVNTQVQINDNGVLGADPGYTYDKTSQTLAVVGGMQVGNPTSDVLAALPVGAPGLACNESLVFGVPAVGVDYIRCKFGVGFVISVNGGDEIPLSSATMVYPPAGIPVSTGSAWDTPITPGAVGHYVRSNGTSYVDSQIQVGDVPTLNQNTTGTAGNLSGTPALPNGVTATTQSPGDATTKVATDAFVAAGLSGKANSNASVNVNGTTCTLGSNCIVSSGSVTSKWVDGTFTSTNSFTITHNFGTLSPHVALFDSAGYQLGDAGSAANITARRVTGINTVAITLSASISGTWSVVGPPNSASVTWSTLTNSQWALMTDSQWTGLSN